MSNLAAEVAEEALELGMLAPALGSVGGGRGGVGLHASPLPCSFFESSRLSARGGARAWHARRRHRAPPSSCCLAAAMSPSTLSYVIVQLQAVNGHISVDQCVGTMDNVCSSTGAVLPVGNQRIHATNSSTEINFQFDPRENPKPQVFLAPMPKRRRLVSFKNERTGPKGTAVSKRHYGKQADTRPQPVPKANEASAGANPFLWSTISSSSTNITFGTNSNRTYCGQLHNVSLTEKSP